MSKVSVFIKAASGIVATTVTLLAALRDNPQIAESIDSAINKVKRATSSENPKLRFEAKLDAISAAADAVAHVDPDAGGPNAWRTKASALRTRGELAWNATTGRSRRRAMKRLDGEVEELLAQVNEHLIGLPDADTDATVETSASM